MIKKLTQVNYKIFNCFIILLPFYLEYIYLFYLNETYHNLQHKHEEFLSQNAIYLFHFIRL